MLAELREPLAAGRPTRFRRAAHSLKSNSQHLRRADARRPGARPRARRLAAGRQPGALDRLDAGIRRAAAALEELADA